MTKTIVLTDGTGQKFVIGSSAQIGRSREENKRAWAVPGREQPPIFSGLEALIRVEDLHASRNHAAVYRRESSFYIEDLNSKNGTEVNDRSLSGGLPRELQEGDVIDIMSTGHRFKVNFAESQDYALLVGGVGDHPGALESSISAFQREVRRRGYIPSILTGAETTKQAVYDKIEEIKHLSVPESHVFLYFHSHGNQNGIVLGRQILNPRELYQKIKQVRGRKAVVIDCCRAGIFVDEHNRRKIPEGTLVLAASGPERNAGETRRADGEYMPRFSDALIRYLQAHPGEINLREFYSEARRDFGTNLLLQEPVMEGVSYTVPREISEFCSRSVG